MDIEEFDLEEMSKKIIKSEELEHTCGFYLAYCRACDEAEENKYD